MANFGRGMALLQDMNAQFSNNFGDRLPKLWLKDGDTAKFWFLYTPEEMPVVLVHMETRFSKKKQKTYNQDVLCAKERPEDPDSVCPRCIAQAADTSEKPKLRGPFPRGIFVVWCDVIAHRFGGEGSQWRRVMIKSKATGDSHPVWMQDMQSLALFLPSGKLAQQLAAVLLGDITDPDNGGVDPMEFPFSLIVNGAGEKRTDVIKVGAKVDPPEAVREARKTLPDIEAIIKAEYGPVPTKGSVVASGNGTAARPEAAAGAEGAADEAVDYDLDGGGAATDPGDDDYEF